MKLIVLVLTFTAIVSTTLLSAQEVEPFNRKGRVLIENGYNLIAGYGKGTGLTYLQNPSGETLTSIGFNGGLFISQNFALKFNLGLLNSSLADDDISVNSIGLAAKYYIAGRIPIELGIGSLSLSSDHSAIANFDVGYGIPLARNINLEPRIGLLITNQALLEFGVNFALFL